MIIRKTFLYLFDFVTLVSCTTQKDADMAEKPNLVFVFADQFRKQSVGFMHEDSVITPNLDKFAQEGVAFTNAVSTTPICSPFRAMLLTGRFPLSTGITSNCMPGTDLEMNADEITIGDILKESGYSTGYIGKWHLEIPSLNKSKNPPDSVLDSWDGWTPPGPRRHGFDFWYAYNCNGKHFDPNYWSDRYERIDIDEWSVTHETNKAFDFIKNRDKEKPFALFMSWNPPHDPYIAPVEFKALYEKKDLSVRPNVKDNQLFRRRYMPYMAAVSSCDHEFGRLLNFLKEKKLDNNTIVVFTSDHGEMMGSHGRFAKSVWYEESNGIPFLIRWPGKITPQIEEMPFASYNFMPTLLGLLNLKRPKPVEGDDYSDLLLGKPQQKASSAFIAMYGNPGKLLAIGQEPSIWALEADSIHKAGIDWRKRGYRGVKTDRYTYVVQNEDFQLTRYLYDNQEDPYQINPIIFKENEIKNKLAMQLETELKNWLKRTNDPFPLTN